jgi:hypothetical protein
MEVALWEKKCIVYNYSSNYVITVYISVQFENNHRWFKSKITFCSSRLHFEPILTVGNFPNVSSEFGILAMKL